jgi:hypothetical protein
MLGNGQRNLEREIVDVMNKRLFISVLTVIMVLITVSASAKRYAYINVYKPSSLFTIYDKKKLFAIGDVLKDATICKEGDTYYCVVSSGFSFYVPKDELLIEKKWIVDDEIYHITGRFRGGLGNFDGMVYLIERQDKDNIMKFLYSKKSGLVGFGGTSMTSSAFYMLSGKCGFANDGSCL